MIISFSGNDGSGKTTLINSLKKSLIKDNQKLEIEVRHEFDYFLLKYLLKILNRRSKSLKKEYLKPAKTNKSKFVGFMWSMLVCTDLFFEYFYLKIYSKLFKKIIILDRCLFDFYISWQYLGVSTNLTKFILSIFPSYDASIVLYVEPELAYKRKAKTHSYPLDFYKKQTERYLGLKKIRKDLKYINTSSSLERSIKDVQKVFLKDYFKINSCDKNNFSLFVKFVSLNVDKDLLCFKDLKRYKSPVSFESIIKKDNFAIIKSFYLDSKSTKNEIDIYTNELKRELIKKLNKKNIKYHEEPDRLGFVLGETEFDLHLGLSFWNHIFIRDDGMKPTRKYFNIEIEYLIYSIHSVYKHGKLSMDDICASMWILQDESKIQSQKSKIFQLNEGWNEGFYYFNNQLREKILDNDINSNWVPIYKYFYFWVKIYLKDRSLGLKQLIVIQYAYLRDRYIFFRNISSLLVNSMFGNSIKKRLGYVYE